MFHLAPMFHILIQPFDAGYVDYFAGAVAGVFAGGA